MDTRFLKPVQDTSIARAWGRSAMRLSPFMSCPLPERLSLRTDGSPRTSRWLVLTLALATAGLVTTAHATTWQVPSVCPTIQAGVDSAAVGDTVLVACGTYYEHDIVMKSGVCLTSETGEASCATIDAEQMGRGIYCRNVGSATSIVGFTITGGLATGTATQDSLGGGIYCEDSSPTLANCAFLYNHADLAGGGLSGGSDPGRALWSRRLRQARELSSLVRSGPTVTDCTFSENSSIGGGGAFLGLASSTVSRCTFYGNTGERGGALYCASDESDLNDCVFFGNQSDNSGGAMYISAWSSTSVTDCDFLHNTSARHGGAVRSEQNASPTFTGVTFERNVAVWSGGAALCEDGSVTFDHVEFKTNTCGGAGGGIRCNLSASATLTNATFYNNVAAHGSAVYCSGGTSASLSNCIIAFGCDETSAVLCGDGGSIDMIASNVFGNGGGDWVDCIADQSEIDGNFSADPLFCDAELGDLSLYLNSPCLPGNHPNGGDWGLIGARGAGCPATGIAESTHEASWGAIKAMFR
jgi:predicted outer membrane repeat protein